MNHSYIFRPLLGLFVVLLAGCAGGGGGGASGPGQLVIAAGSPPSGMTGATYPGFTFAVASGGTAPFTWSETGTLPPGLSLSATGGLSGTPFTAGDYSFTVTATDSSNPQLTRSTPVSVKIDDSLIVISTSPMPPGGMRTQPFPSFAFTATGGSPPYTWNVKTGALPVGLTLGADGSIIGTVSSTAVSSTFTVAATDSAQTPQSIQQPFTVVVNNPPPPAINLVPPPTATVGMPYSFQFTATGGFLPLVWSETPAGSNPLSLPNLGLSFGGLLSGTPSGAGIFPITVNVIDQLKQIAPPMPFTVRVSLARPAATFTSTLGTMTTARSGHTATLLLSGKVLVAGGGQNAGVELASAELYDPTTEMFTATTGPMAIARSGHTATILADAALANYGKVLIAGGAATTLTAELYDPTTGMFTATGSMQAMRSGQTATWLNTGQVLVAGGGTASAELYNPASGTFIATGSMTVSRTGHTATLLPNGMVLIAGGGTATAELYDPASGKFTATGSMSEVRTWHTATLLANGTVLTNGKVLIAGPYAAAELFDPASGSFSSVGNPLTTIFESTATLRNDGTVLVAGGRVGSYTYLNSLASAQLFAPESEGFTTTGSLLTARDGHTATVLADGSVLVTGGINHKVVATSSRGYEIATVLSSAELFK